MGRPSLSRNDDSVIWNPAIPPVAQGTDWANLFFFCWRLTAHELNRGESVSTPAHSSKAVQAPRRARSQAGRERAEGAGEADCG